jgi:hypothetical protein
VSSGSFFILVCFLAQFFCVRICAGQNVTRTRPEITGNLKKDLRNLLRDGAVPITILGTKPSERLLGLTARFQQALSENRDWFLEYVKGRGDKLGLPYHEKMGLTEAEYNELTTSLLATKLIPMVTEDVIIKRKGREITFNNNGALSILRELQIDRDGKKISFGDYELLLKDTVKTVGNKNVLSSSWKGYTWQFDYPQREKGTLIEAARDISNFTLIKYQLYLGRLDNDGRSFMMIRGTEVVRGRKSIEFETTLIF